MDYDFEVRVFESDKFEIWVDIPDNAPGVIITNIPGNALMRVVQGLKPGLTYASSTRALNLWTTKDDSPGAVLKDRKALSASAAPTPGDKPPEEASWGMWSEVFVFETLRSHSVKIHGYGADGLPPSAALSSPAICEA